jgi:UDP-N-acetylmuramoylalanine--D-glutamate ligase
MKQPFYLIAGLGKTGRSIASFLQRRNCDFAMFDTRSVVDGLSEFQEMFSNKEIFLEHIPDTLYSKLTGIIASPGVSLDHPVLLKAVEYNIPIIGDIECLAREITASVIAITGTNGKSTVTTLVGEMAKAAGFHVAVAGNIGTPVLDLLDDGQQYDLWVLELSSFQLDLLFSLKPKVASILNISKDHLDRHKDYEAYVAAKQRIYDHAQIRVFNRDDMQTYPEKQDDVSEELSFGLSAAQNADWGIIDKEGDSYLAKGLDAWISVKDLRLKGKQNWSNALAAAAMADAIGIKRESILTVLRNFAGLPHRCQWLRTLNAIDWINDSKGTNTGAAVAAISGIGGSISGKIILIAGGLGKGADFKELRPVVSDYVRTVVLIGTDAGLMAEALQGTASVVHANSLQEAVLQAQKCAQTGDVVLLSPACASFDMFRDFNHRGESFAELVSSL